MGYPLSMDISYRQETIFLVTKQTTVLSFSNGLFLERGGIVNIRTLWRVEICRVIYKISRNSTISILEPNQPNGLEQINLHFDHTRSVWSEWDFQFICPEWQEILSVQYMAKQLSCKILYIWLLLNLPKRRVLSFAAIIIALRTRWLCERALSLALGDMNLFVDNWLQISTYSYKVSPIAIVLQYELITLMT
jgi:hypothetical protein